MSEKIEVYKRHYCSHCGRKREEVNMHEHGRGAFGKKKWRCIDLEGCDKAKTLKEAL